jgi:hypothetical protein
MVEPKERSDPAEINYHSFSRMNISHEVRIARAWNLAFLDVIKTCYFSTRASGPVQASAGGTGGTDLRPTPGEVSIGLQKDPHTVSVKKLFPTLVKKHLVN